MRYDRRTASKKQNRSSFSRGFTIVELLIATSVFSVVLLIFSVTFTRIGKLFYKGVVTSKTQETARALIDDISQSVQFNGGVIPLLPPGHVGISDRNGSKSWLCIGQTMYVFKVNQKAGAGNKVLEKQKLPPGGCGETSINNDFLAANMRLLDLRIEPIAGANEVYNVFVAVAFGDDSQFDTYPGSTNSSSNCTGGSGSQFCAVSRLQTTVIRRVN